MTKKNMRVEIRIHAIGAAYQERDNGGFRTIEAGENVND